MSIQLGLDVGTTSLKLALIATSQQDTDLLESLVSRKESFISATEFSSDAYPGIFISVYERIKGDPSLAIINMLEKTFSFLPENVISAAGFTGTGGKSAAQTLGIPFFNDCLSVTEAMALLEPEARTVFEMGGVASKFMLLSPDPKTNKLRLNDFEISGDCAAGTGSFIDQQALRLQYQVEDIAELAMNTERSPTIAGRCSVFAKSDMIHAQQKGYKPDEILKGLCEAVARNYKSSICKGKEIISPVAFIGGVAWNDAIVESLKNLFELTNGELYVPEHQAFFGAIGAALMAGESDQESAINESSLLTLQHARNSIEFPTSRSLDLEKVKLLRNRVMEYNFPENGERIKAFLGVDIGSISTNLVIIDTDGNIVHEIYTRTNSRPIDVVGESLREIERDVGDRIDIQAVGVTGSGRELIGELIGADAIHDEITAHQTGANYIAKKLLNTTVDTIFEIGGQDSKFISLQNGIVVDFAMNEACAAGTGSFLEERAEELDISIKGEFAKLALESEAPVRLGERCTVFIESDVKHYLNQGAKKEDIIAGLAYSVAYNYINRVVRGREVGNTIFFQGGTAYNDAVAAAFSKILDREVIVPPHNGVVGAYGVALLSKDKMEALHKKTSYRGYHIENINFTSKEFTCKACSNFCDIIRYDIEGEKSFWGDRCSDRYRKKTKVEKQAVIKDLLAERMKLLLADHEPDSGNGPTIGMPRAMYFYERFPFWNAFLKELDFNVQISDETSSTIIKKGYDATIAEPCFPIKVAHGHIQDLIDKDVDYVLLPNNINAKVHPEVTVNSYYCPWNTTLPFMAKSAKSFSDWKDRFLAPMMKYRNSDDLIVKELYRTFKPLGVKKKRIESALADAMEVQNAFSEKLVQLGIEALDTVMEKHEKAVILVGRPYNLYDAGSNLETPNKLRNYYGVNPCRGNPAAG